MADADSEAARALRAASSEGLLRTYASLTHRMHAGEEARGKRDAVEAEILRRMKK
jgi:hypothetical protein